MIIIRENFNRVLKMKPLRILTCSSLIIFTACTTGCNQSGNSSDEKLISAKQQLGKQIFFDTSLSSPVGQACSSCHSPSSAFTDPDKELPVSRGANPERFGQRNTPTVAYAMFSPAFHFDQEEGIFFGGQFLDGRASSLQQQAVQPFLNPLEMANPDKYSVIEKISQSSYADQFKVVYGETIFNDIELAFESVADAIASFEMSNEVNPFNSKFDLYIEGKVTFTAEEQRGLELFINPDKGNCAACHPASGDTPEQPALFTDFSYDNLGVPANPDSPFLSQDLEFNPAGSSFVDLGLGHELASINENGKFKVPSLRNVALTSPYMHNGVFNSLQQVLDFYNERNADGIVPEALDNVNNDELGDLGLSDQEKSDIISFLKTLSDGYSEQ